MLVSSAPRRGNLLQQEQEVWNSGLMLKPCLRHCRKHPAIKNLQSSFFLIADFTMKVMCQRRPFACLSLKMRVHFATSVFFLTKRTLFKSSKGIKRQFHICGQMSVSYDVVAGQYQGLGAPHNLDMSLKTGKTIKSFKTVEERQCLS